jgi:hypothetical protein
MVRDSLLTLVQTYLALRHCEFSARFNSVPWVSFIDSVGAQSMRLYGLMRRRWEPGYGCLRVSREAGSGHTEQNSNYILL